jgi:hypothetical protein
MLAAMLRVDRQTAQRELGAAWQLVELNEVATSDYLLQELSPVDRLDGMIDRCHKRFLFLRGLKSISTASAPAETENRQPAIIPLVPARKNA